MVGTSRTSEKGMLIARCPESAGPDHRDVACQSRASCAKLQGSGDLVLLFAGFVSDGGIDENDDDVDALLVNMGYFKSVIRLRNPRLLLVKYVLVARIMASALP
jgi:hypothetical protein